MTQVVEITRISATSAEIEFDHGGVRYAFDDIYVHTYQGTALHYICNQCDTKGNAEVEGVGAGENRTASLNDLLQAVMVINSLSMATSVHFSFSGGQEQKAARTMLFLLQSPHFWRSKPKELQNELNSILDQ